MSDITSNKVLSSDQAKEAKRPFLEILRTNVNKEVDRAIEIEEMQKP